MASMLDFGGYWLSFYGIIGLVSQLISSVCRLIPELCLLYLFISLSFFHFCPFLTPCFGNVKPPSLILVVFLSVWVSFCVSLFASCK